MILNKIGPILKFEGMCDCGNNFVEYITLAKFKNDNNSCILRCSSCSREFNVSNVKVKKVNDSEKGIKIREINND